jgi:MerR family transcriptional regulator, mercuric resistance operon regulatory protein
MTGLVLGGGLSPSRGPGSVLQRASHGIRSGPRRPSSDAVATSAICDVSGPDRGARRARVGATTSSRTCWAGRWPGSAEGLDLVPGYRVYPAGMRSSQVAAQAGVNIQTLRYYERRGLLPEPSRSGSGYRAYDAQAVRTVCFVKRAQQLGFSLEDIDGLLKLAAGGPASCDAARALATEKVAELEAKIASLSAMRNSLRQLVVTCDRTPNERDCPLLEAIEYADESVGEHP